MNFEHRPTEQRELIARILSYGEKVVTEAQAELKFAVGVSNMSIWTPSLKTLLEVCEYIRCGKIKKWREDQMNRAVREIEKVNSEQGAVDSGQSGQEWTEWTIEGRAKGKKG